VAKPTTRQEFADYCLRRLGGGAIKINVTDDQVTDRIDDAINYYQQYHHSGSQKVYLAHQIATIDKTNRYVAVPDTIIGITRMFPMSTSLGSSSLFSLSYQFAQSDFLASALTGSLLPYWMAMTQIELINQILVGEQPIRFNQHTDKVWIDMNWDNVAVGTYLILEGYEALDPETNPQAWADLWLQRYTTALIKRQWGENTKKFGAVPGPGGVTINGQMIFDEAESEIAKLEREMLTSFSLPAGDFIG
jgi:hypothetical protein